MRKLHFKDIFKENKGQIFTIDVLFAIIIVVIVIGMSADALDVVVFKISDYSAGKSLDRIATDAADILIDTPGSPDWEKSNSTQSVTPGLAESNNGSKNTTKVLSFAKIAQLENRYPELMANVLPLAGNSSLTIYPINSTLKPLDVGIGTPPPEVTEIAVVNRTVLVNFKDYKILTCIDGASGTDICPHNNYPDVTGHINPDSTVTPNGNVTPSWNCRAFKVTQNDLNTTDFYILTDPPVLENSATWILDSPDNISQEQETFQRQPIRVNDKIYTFMGGDGEVVMWLHVLGSYNLTRSFNTYLIGVPKGTSSEEVRIEYLNPYPCFFVLKIWIE